MRSERAMQLRDELNAIRSKERLGVTDIIRVNEIGELVASDISDQSRRSQLNDLGRPSDIVGRTEPRTLGAALIESAEYRVAAEAIRESESPRFHHVVELKAAGDPVLEGTGDNADAIAPTWLPRVYAPGLVAYPTRIQAVLTTRQLTTGNSAMWPTVTTRSIEDMTDTAEAENKAGAEFGFDVSTETLKKWTAFTGASEELFQDAPTLTNYIDNQLLSMSLEKEEGYIAETLYTLSTTAADGTGIGGVAGYDAVLEAMTMVRLAGGNPTAVLINPMDWARMAATRSIAGDGTYFSGGPYAAPADRLWGGLTEVQTPRVPEGTALVGDFRDGATLFRKGGPRVESSNAHDDFFRRNLVALRSEVRSVLGVHNAEFFVEVEIGS
ncbi:MAG: phage major capsid protein [Actinomycetota bacterium]